MTNERERGRRASGENLSLLLEQILADAHGENEQLLALRHAFESNVRLPAAAFVIGEPVEVTEIDYDNNTRRGLVARCRRPDGDEHLVGAAELSFPEGSEGARHVAVYRNWLGLEPAPAPDTAVPRRPKRYKATGDEFDLSDPIELVVLAPKERAARCWILGTHREITLRSADVWNMVPGEIITVRAHKQWRYAGHPYLSGDMKSHRLEVKALGLVPLCLRDQWPWDPAEQYWREEFGPLDEWVKAIVARGPRPSYEMEQVRPGADSADWDSDPILEAIELAAGGDGIAAEKLLVDILAADLRCLDAHAHLGDYGFELGPDRALRHFEAGVRIGELSLGEDFDGVLPWDRTDNRPFLRCLHGFGLCLWRLGRDDEAAAIFERMLWLDPTDKQAARLLLPQVRAGERWEDLDDDP